MHLLLIEGIEKIGPDRENDSLQRAHPVFHPEKLAHRTTDVLLDGSVLEQKVLNV